jgi:hypothetical protein
MNTHTVAQHKALELSQLLGRHAEAAGALVGQVVQGLELKVVDSFPCFPYRESTAHTHHKHAHTHTHTHTAHDTHSEAVK